MASGEQTLLVTRPTRLIALRYWTSMIFALVLAAVFGLKLPWRFASTFPNPDLRGIDLSTILTGLFVFLAFLAFLAAELKRKSTRYIITDNKVIREDGILSKNTEMVPYAQLERVDLHQTFGERILKIETIRNPAQVQQMLSDRLGRRGWTGQTPTGQQPPATR